MPLNHQFLETEEVIRLTHHFLEEKKGATCFSECQFYSQMGVGFSKFGDSPCVAVAQRPNGQPPVLFACYGEHDDNREEEKRTWCLSDSVFSAMCEWVNRQEEAKLIESPEQKETESKQDKSQSHLDFDFHISLRKRDHWTVYVFKFRGAQSSHVQKLFTLQAKHAKEEKPRKPTDRGDGCDLIRANEKPDASFITTLIRSAYVLVGQELFHIDKRQKEKKGITSDQINGITSGKINELQKMLSSLDAVQLNEDQLLEVTRITGHVHGEGSVIAEEYSAQEERQKKERHAVLGELYEEVTIFYIDSKRWRVPEEITTDMRNVFKKPELSIQALNCPYQSDGYSCGECSALNAVLAACPLENNTIIYERDQDAYGLRLQAMAILNIPLVKDSDIFFSSYLLLRFIGVVAVSLLLGYFLNAAALAVFGGFWGMLGIALGGWLLCEIGNGFLKEFERKGNNKEEQDRYEKFKPKLKKNSKTVDTDAVNAVSINPEVASAKFGVNEYKQPASLQQPRSLSNTPGSSF